MVCKGIALMWWEQLILKKKIEQGYFEENPSWNRIMRLPNLELLEWVILERKITEFEDKFMILQCRREMGVIEEFDMREPRGAVAVYKIKRTLKRCGSHEEVME